jgi:hypothetical protein
VAYRYNKESYYQESAAPRRVSFLRHSKHFIPET